MPWPWAPFHDSIQYLHNVQSKYQGVKTGVLQSGPPSTTLSLVLEQKCCTGTTSVLRKIEQKWMCQSHGILHLPSSLIRTVVLPLHLYLPTAWFRNIVTFLSRMRNGSVWNSPSGSTWITSQFITWLQSCRYFLRKETWKTLWALVLAGNAILYANDHILSSTSNDP